MLALPEKEGPASEASPLKIIDKPESTTTAGKGKSPQARWAENHPLQRWAHRCVESAIKRGLLIRQCCEVCGDERTDFHHDDYERPLRGTWLCRLHHKREHVRLRKAGAG